MEKCRIDKYRNEKMQKCRNGKMGKMKKCRRK